MDHREGFQRNWSWGMPVLPYLYTNGRFSPPSPASDLDDDRQDHYDWNSEKFGVNHYTDGAAGMSERYNSLPINYEKTCEVRVRRFCCEGCVMKVQKRLRNIPGVSAAHCNVENRTVNIRGTADPELILKTLGRIRYLDPELSSELAFTPRWSTSSSGEISASN